MTEQSRRIGLIYNPKPSVVYWIGFEGKREGNEAMKTKLMKIEEDCPDREKIREAGEILRRGGLVAFPTETVYGLGGDALNPDSSRKIYAAKGRPSDNPLIVHICRWEDIHRIADPVPEAAEKLARAFWPGPLTMILKKTDLVPEETTGGLDTVAVRFPSDPVARAFIDAAGGFVAAPSANRSGRPSPTLAKYVLEDMDGKIEMILDGGEVGIGLESTIVDLTGEEPMILRPGFVTKEMLQEVLTRVEVDRTILDPDCHLRPKAPGMRYRHYAPQGELIIVEGERETVISAICEKCDAAKARGERVGSDRHRRNGGCLSARLQGGQRQERGQQEGPGFGGTQPVSHPARIRMTRG